MLSCYLAAYQSLTSIFIMFSIYSKFVYEVMYLLGVKKHNKQDAGHRSQTGNSFDIKMFSHADIVLSHWLAHVCTSTWIHVMDYWDGHIEPGHSKHRIYSYLHLVGVALKRMNDCRYSLHLLIIEGAEATLNRTSVLFPDTERWLPSLFSCSSAGQIKIMVKRLATGGSPVKLHENM